MLGCKSSSITAKLPSTSRGFVFSSHGQVVRAASPLHRGEGRHCAEKAKVQAVGMSQANSSLGPLIFIVLSLP